MYLQNNTSANGISAQNLTSLESAQVIKAIKPQHPALSRLHTELKSAGGTSTITSYDRMHHRHSRS